MSKLDRLKKWFTLTEAAEFLGDAIGEPSTTKVDILRLARDGHLKLAADFPNHATGIPGNLVELNQLENKVTTLAGLLPDPSKAILLSDDTTTINGIWNISVYGDAGSLIEKLFHKLTDGPCVNRSGNIGVFIEHPNDPTSVIQVMTM